MKRDFILLAVLVTAILALGIWFSRTYEWRTEEVEVGFQGEAARNPLLAAVRFLEKTDTPVTSVDSVLQLEDMPKQFDVVVISTERFDFSPERTARFHQWVENGGHLIVTARRPGDTPGSRDDPLLDPYGIRFSDGDEDDALDELDSAPIDEITDSGAAEQIHTRTDCDEQEVEKLKTPAEDCEETIKVKFDDDGDSLLVHFDPGKILEITGDTDPDWYVADALGVYLVEYRLGSGWLTVLNDFDFMHTENIRKHDHAAFLWRLLHIDQHRGSVWFITHEDIPALSALIWAAGKPVVIVLLALLAAWLWKSSRRFGPVLASPPPPRRSLREHIRASGFFFWQTQQQTLLLENTRQAVHAQIEILHPGWKSLQTDDLFARLAEASGLPVEEITHALQADEVVNEAQFTRYIHTLETVRKKL